MADIKITPTALTGQLSAKISPDQLNIQQAAVKTTPPSLSNAPRAVTLRGEVQATNDDGTTQIRTQRGTVTVRLENPLPQGQRVDIQLASGQPPREAIVQAVQNQRTAPQTQSAVPQPTQNQAPQQPQQTTAPASNPQTAKAPPPSENIDGVRSLQTTAKQASETIANTVRQSVNPETMLRDGAQPQAPSKPLMPGQAVRLSALPPAMQNPTALAQFQSISTGQPIIQTQIQGPIQTAAILTPLSTNQTAGQITSPVQIGMPGTLNTPTLKAPNIMPQNTASAIASINNTAIIPTGKLLNTTTTMPGDMRVISVQLPSATSTPQNQMITAPLKAGQVMAQATGAITPSGNPILQLQTPSNMGLIMANAPVTAPATSGPFFAINYPATNVPKGTQIILQPLPNTAQAPTLPALSSWPIMEDAFEFLLTQLNGAQGQSLLNTIPRPASAGFQFSAAALLFVAAARGGDIAGWMGNRADAALKSASATERDNLASRLLRDITASTARAPGADAPPSIQNAPDWRGYTLPLLFGMDITKMNLWTKPYGDDENADDTDAVKGMRFIVDLDLSRMGNVQLDGLIQTYAKRMDLTLKTEQAFGDETRQHLRSLWNRALNTIEMSGAIDFQIT